jgi:hypothetical protein
VAGLVCLAGCCAVTSALAQYRGLRSRAAFAALDSAALADSSAILRLDPRDPTDSVLLGMVSFLDRHAGERFGLPPTRIRRWDGFGTQAHPDLGILVDDQEISRLLDEVSTLKLRAGRSPAEIKSRLHYVLRFLVAHEYGHLMQYRYFGRDFVNSANATRIIECAADLLGGFNYRMYLTSRYTPAALPQEAIEVPEGFGYVIGSRDWLDGTVHPTVEDRTRCIHTGITAAAGVNAVTALRGGSTDSSMVRSAKSLEADEPELFSRAVDLMGWSQLRAWRITSAHSVVGRTAELDVIRAGPDVDAALENTLRTLANAAAKGKHELRKHRSSRAPGGESKVYLLRESLPVPWRCTIGEVNQAEEALCQDDSRDSRESMQIRMKEVVRSLEAVLNRRVWKQPPYGGTMAACGGKPAGESLDTLEGEAVVYVACDRKKHRLRAEIRVVLEGEEDLMAQLPQTFDLSLAIRAQE